MIVGMKKLLLLCPAKDQDATLETLRGLGVVHVEHTRAPEGELLADAHSHLLQVQRALEVVTPARGLAPSGIAADTLVQDVANTTRELKDVDDQLEALAREVRRVLPYGSFNPATLAGLKAKGLSVSLFQLPTGQPLPVIPGGVLQELSRDSSGVYLAAINSSAISLDVPEFRWPEQSLEAMRVEQQELGARRVELQARLDSFSADYPVLHAFQSEAEDRVRYLEARAGMGEHGPVVILRGFCPEDALSALRDAAQHGGWALLEREPAAEDSVPTLIRNPKWIRPIKSVLDFIGVLPGYNEMDISAAFLFFLSLFFAMLVGDAGYGLIFIGLTWWMRRRLPGAPAHLFHLLYIMSACTVAWGALTGTWFGAAHLPAALDSLTVAWLKEPRNVMFLCFVIGSVHLTLAHLWILARTWNRPTALAQVGWIGVTWTMFFTARNLVLGHELPSWIGWLLAGSTALVVLFMTAPRDLRHEWFNHVMLPLTLVSNFVDVVSYIRLFAVGTAGYAVASSFNTMILGGGVEGILAGLGAALLLFIGHALNIALCIMGVLVHGVRLNTLEFSSHIGMTWTGEPYRPFRRVPREGQLESATQPGR